MKDSSHWPFVWEDDANEPGVDAVLSHVTTSNCRGTTIEVKNHTVQAGPKVSEVLQFSAQYFCSNARHNAV